MKLGGLSSRITVITIAVLAVGSAAQAQTKLSPVAPEPSVLRTDWQQRVVGAQRQFGARRTSGGAWASTKTVSTPVDTAPMLAAEGQTVGEMDALPEDVELDPGLAPAELGDCLTCGDGYCGGPVCDTCGDPCGTCYGGCGPCGYRTRPWVQHLSFSLGVQGFKGSVDQGVNGNFGFNEGVNWSAPLGRCTPIGYQIGFRATQSNLDGDQVIRPETNDREQTFVTAGLFRRAPCGGLQGGVAYDYLRDRYYYGSVDLGQVRTELSWAYGNRGDFGFWGAHSTTDDQVADQLPFRLVPNDLYALFYRQHLACGGDWRLWAGMTGEGDGLVGADFAVPLGWAWALESNFTYLTPDRDAPQGIQAEESWGIAISFVWYPGKDAHAELQSPYRPLFGLADNSVFLVDLR